MAGLADLGDIVEMRQVAGAGTIIGEDVEGSPNSAGSAVSSGSVDEGVSGRTDAALGQGVSDLAVSAGLGGF